MIAQKRILLGGRLLLGNAVERAESEDQIAARNSGDFAIWKQARECIQRHAIVRIIESGHEHDLVGYVEIRVACGKALTIEMDGRRHWERFHAQRPAVLIFHGLEQGEILLKGGIVGILWVVFQNGYDR